uniref:Uncharacterized protein n=1 Tax=Brassica oleracea var. oleracea TaxID=109376 RepID=A0A0D3CB75_BRAOL
MVFQIWKTSGQEDFHTTSMKSSRRLPGSFLTESSPISPFHNRSERFGNLLDDFKEVFDTTFRKSYDWVFFHIKWSLSLSL